MSARILVVDDEPDVETLILQKFRQKIKDGAISFLFARDGLEALAALKTNNPDAIAAFAAHVGKLPKDRLASFHLKRLLNGATGARIEME